MEQSTNQKILPDDWMEGKEWQKVIKKEYEVLNNHWSNYAHLS
jgi:hypothetical protein